MHEKNDSLDKDNYRPVYVLSTLSTLLEKMTVEQLIF